MNEHAKNLRRTRADMLGTDDEAHYLECQKAADEIERLTEIKDLAIKDCMAEAKENEHLHAEIERLRKGWESLEWESKQEIERLRAVVEHCAVVRMCSKCADALGS